MRRTNSTLLALALALAYSTQHYVATSLPVNGWYPCTITDETDQPWLADVGFQCATVAAPLCHEGVCSSDKTLELFVKRKLAADSGDYAGSSEKTKKSAWFLAGGPGASSASMETAMLNVYALSNGTVSVYTMDHRGTGRSGYLDCVAAQAQADGSPGGSTVTLKELPTCIADILQQLDGHTEAFSVTSAARDVVYLLDGLADDEDEEEVFLYGASYGTFLVERVIHLAPPQVKGYVLDGVVSESGADADTRLFFSHWDRNIMEPSRRFFEICAQQQDSCPLKLPTAYSSGGSDTLDVMQAVHDIYQVIDDARNDCAVALLSLTDGDTPSDVLRLLLGLLVRDPVMREWVPSIMARLQRCSQKDYEELDLVSGTLFQLVLEQNGGGATTLSATVLKTARARMEMSPLLNVEVDTSGLFGSNPADSLDELVYMLISYSELWASPPPTQAEMKKFYFDGIFSLGLSDLLVYCLLSGNLAQQGGSTDRDQACSEMAAELKSAGGQEIINSTQRFVYDPDEFANRTANVPPHTSVLLFNGGLDFRTPWEFGRYQFDTMELSDPDTSQKMLVEFDLGGHVCGIAPTTAEDETFCGLAIVTSFILSSGDPQAVDTSCVGNLPGLKLSDEAFAGLVESVLQGQQGQLRDGSGGYGAA